MKKAWKACFISGCDILQASEICGDISVSHCVAPLFHPKCIVYWIKARVYFTHLRLQNWSSTTGLFAWPVVSADVSGSCSCLLHWRKTELKNRWTTYIWHMMSKKCDSVTSWRMSMLIILHCLNWFWCPENIWKHCFLPGSFFTCGLRQDGIQLL